MASFEKAIPIILKHEGGFVNHSSDPGGATNYGISLRFLRGLPIIDADLNGDGNVDIEDIKNMTAEQAIKLYKKYFWDTNKYQNINDDTIATKIFDMTVNMGAKRSHMITQTALNKCFGMKLTVDGILGPATISVINAIEDDNEQIVLTTICQEQFAFYLRLVEQKPELKVFINGWKRRAFSLSKANTI